MRVAGTLVVGVVALRFSEAHGAEGANGHFVHAGAAGFHGAGNAGDAIGGTELEEAGAAVVPIAMGQGLAVHQHPVVHGPKPGFDHLLLRAGEVVPYPRQFGDMTIAVKDGVLLCERGHCCFLPLH